MRKLKYINRITSLAVTIILFAASMLLFEACSSDKKDIGYHEKKNGYHENNRVSKIKSAAENEVGGAYSVISMGVETITSAVKMTGSVVSGVLRININMFGSIAEKFRNSIQAK